MRRFKLAAILWLLSAAPSAAEDVIVALTDSTPNFSMHQPDGSITGINMDLARLLCQRLELRCRYQLMPLAALVAHVRDGKAQIGFGNLTKTPEREKDMLFSQPYWRSTSVFVGHRDLAGHSMDDLVRGRKVAVQEGSRQAKWLADKYGGSYIPVPRPTIFDVIATLPLQQAHLILAPMMTVHPFLISTDGTDFGFVSAPIDSGWPVHIVLNKDRPDLQQRLDKALEDASRDGSLGAIVRTYVPFDIF